MAMNIKNAEAERLARAVARMTGESLTTAITESLRERLDRLRRERGKSLAERLLEIGRNCAPRLKEPLRPGDIDDLLYDERGLPK